LASRRLRLPAGNGRTMEPAVVAVPAALLLPPSDVFRYGQIRRLPPARQSRRLGQAGTQSHGRIHSLTAIKKFSHEGTRRSTKIEDRRLKIAGRAAGQFSDPPSSILFVSLRVPSWENNFLDEKPPVL